MAFKKDEVETFKALFDQHKQSIASQPGCQHLELLQDKSDSRIFMTYSHWEDEESLTKYRHSDLFGIVWPQTKALFEEKPQAWSFERMKVNDPQ